MTDADKLDYAKRYLRRKRTVAQIEAIADLAAAALLTGKTRIAIKSSSFDGGSSSGDIEFEAGITGMACEALLAEAATLGITGAQTFPAASLRRRISTTVVFGGFIR